MDKIVEYYNELASTYDENRFENEYGKFIDAQERILLNKLLTDNNDLILDLACGSGRLLDFASVGTDASEKMLEIAQKKHKNKKLVLSDAEQLQFETDTFDKIISFHFFMHLNDEKIEEILNECHRVLKKDGKLIFDIPSLKRRNLFNYKSNGWHGANSTTVEKLKQHPNFRISNIHGLLFLPIHRFPKFSRRFFIKLDLILSNSLLKEYSSYLVVEFVKQ